MKTIILLLSQLTFLFPYLIYSQSAALDTTFGGVGIVQTDVGGDLDIVHTMLIQPDGKILVAGISDIPGNFGDAAIVRYNLDGTLDVAFGQNGKVTIAVGTLSDYAIVLKLQPDGKILVGGYYITNGGFTTPFDIADSYLARLNTDGSLDRNFGALGIIKMDYNKNENRLYDIHLQNDGKITTIQYVKPGSTGVSPPGYLLTRFDINGAVDSTFGNQGYIIDTIPNQLGSNYQISFQSDEKFLLAKHFKTDTSSHIILNRYDIEGSIDSTFGNNGSVNSAFENYKDHLSQFLFQPDGKIFIIGYTYIVPSMEDRRTLLLRYDANGKLDSTFGVNGRLLTPYEEYNNNPIFVSNDKILVSGGFGFPVLRFNTDGTLDETFGYNGQIKLDESIGGGITFALQSDGKIVLAGTSPVLNDDVKTLDFMVIRYLTDFSVDVLDFKNKLMDVLVYPNPLAETAVFEYTLSQIENLTLSLYDRAGRLVQQFFTNEIRTAGIHRETLHLNKNLPSGSYLLTLSTPRGRVSVQIVK